MKNAVIDASVAFKWLVWESGSEEALQLLDQITSFHAPDIFLMEMDAILTRKVRKREMKITEALQKKVQLRKLPYLLTPYEKIEEFTFRLCMEFSIALYDGCYLATAVDNQATLFTADLRFSNGLSNTPFGKYVQYVGE